MKKIITLFFVIVFNQTLAQNNNQLVSEIIKNPGDAILNQKLIDNIKDENELIKVYDKLISHCPNSYIIPFIIGQHLFNKENPQTLKYLSKAIKINPKLAEAYYISAIQYQRIGDLANELFYAEEAKKLDLKNGKYAFQAAVSNYKKNKEFADSSMLEVVRKFRNEATGAKALIHMAMKENELTLKKIYLQQLFEFYKDNANENFLIGMDMLYDILINEGNYLKAIELSTSMVITKDNDRLHWQYLLKIAKQYLSANTFLTNGQPDSAILRFNKIKLRDPFYLSFIKADISLLKLKANCYQLMGVPDSSYKIVLQEIINKPSNDAYGLLYQYGSLINKNKQDIDNQVRQLRYRNVEQAYNLVRKNLLDSTQVSLSDYRGKVILLSLWFPSCGPCRKEMPHIENVLKKVDRNKIVYLGLNVNERENMIVKSFLDKTGFTFIPLSDDNNANKGNLFTTGYPTNFLIDKEGKIVFKGFLVDDDSEEHLELMINDLINY